MPKAKRRRGVTQTNRTKPRSDSDEDTGFVDAEPIVPRKASRPEIGKRLDCICLALDAAFDQVSALRRDLHAESFSEPRSSLPVRYLEPGER